MQITPIRVQYSVPYTDPIAGTHIEFLDDRQVSRFFSYQEYRAAGTLALERRNTGVFLIHTSHTDGIILHQSRSSNITLNAST